MCLNSRARRRFHPSQIILTAASEGKMHLIVGGSPPLSDAAPPTHDSVLHSLAGSHLKLSTNRMLGLPSCCDEPARSALPGRYNGTPRCKWWHTDIPHLSLAPEQIVEPRRCLPAVSFGKLRGQKMHDEAGARRITGWVCRCSTYIGMFRRKAPESSPDRAGSDGTVVSEGRREGSSLSTDSRNQDLSVDGVPVNNLSLACSS